MPTIPPIDDKTLETLCTRIKPVLRFVQTTEGLEMHPRGQLYHIEPVDPRHATFMYQPIPKTRARNIRAYTAIETYHTSGGFFHKPSIAEVLAQIPSSLLERTVAFETHSSSMMENRNYTRATTHLYERTTHRRNHHEST